MKRITLVIPSLTSGGAERVMATLANEWATAGVAVTLLTLDDGSEPPFFPLHSEVVHHHLDVAGESGGAIRAVKNNAGRIRRVRRAIVESRPDVVLSFLDTTNVLTLLATRGLGSPVIVEEHTDPSQKTIGLWEPLRRALYPRADRVVVLSDEVRDHMSGRVRPRTVVMPNPIVVPPPAGAAKPASSRRTAIAVGRLGPEKGFDLLLNAFARVAKRHPNWDLVIWGEGPCRTELEEQRERLALTGRVDLPGRTPFPHAELRKADLFVMSSRREGFPMALGEAMACGLATISTDCPSGPRQLIRPKIDGVLVPPDDVEALAVAMSELMANDARREELSSRAPEVLERFGVRQIMSRWEVLFEEVLHERHGGSRPGNRTFGAARTGIPAQSGGYDPGS